MIDSSQRIVLTGGAAAAATPQVLTPALRTSASQEALTSAKIGYGEKGNVRIHYADIGSGFPLLAIPGGSLNSRIAFWANTVINIPKHVKLGRV
jgi:hypothetical protein